MRYNNRVEIYNGIVIIDDSAFHISEVSSFTIRFSYLEVADNLDLVLNGVQYYAEQKSLEESYYTNLFHFVDRYNEYNKEVNDIFNDTSLKCNIYFTINITLKNKSSCYGCIIHPVELLPSKYFNKLDLLLSDIHNINRGTLMYEWCNKLFINKNSMTLSLT